jgi:rod shape-determining protein MreC
MAGARRGTRRRYVLLVIVLTAVTLITLDSRHERSGALGALSRGAHTVMSPVYRAVESVTNPISDWWDGVTDSGELKRENRELREQLLVLEGRDRAAQQAIDKTRELERFLGLDLQVERVHARIVGRNPGNFDSTVVLDHGSERGIAVDMPVVAPDGSLVGTVIEVGRSFAKVRLVTDPDFVVGVTLPAHPDSPAWNSVAEGQTGSRELLAQDVDAQKKVSPGDRVVTSPSVESVYPPDLPVGTVTRVVPRPGGQPQRVFIRPYVDVAALDYVAVLLWVKGEGPVVPVSTTTTTTGAPTTTVPGATVTTIGNGVG